MIQKINSESLEEKKIFFQQHSGNHNFPSILLINLIPEANQSYPNTGTISSNHDWEGASVNSDFNPDLNQIFSDCHETKNEIIFQLGIPCPLMWFPWSYSTNRYLPSFPSLIFLSSHGIITTSTPAKKILF